MATVNALGAMVPHMLENGKMVTCMETEFCTFLLQANGTVSSGIWKVRYRVSRALSAVCFGGFSHLVTISAAAAVVEPRESFCYMIYIDAVKNCPTRR